MNSTFTAILWFLTILCSRKVRFIVRQEYIVKFIMSFIAHLHTADGYLNFCIWLEIQIPANGPKHKQWRAITSQRPRNTLQFLYLLHCWGNRQLSYYPYFQDPLHSRTCLHAHWSFPSNIQIAHSFPRYICGEGKDGILRQKEAGPGYHRDCHNPQHCFDNIVPSLILTDKLLVLLQLSSSSPSYNCGFFEGGGGIKYA